MKVRNKLFIVMAVVICLMASVFFFLTNDYLGGLFRQYGQAARTGSAEQVSRLLAYYYETNHQSWAGADQYVLGLFQPNGGIDRSVRPESLAVLDTNNRVVAEIGPHHKPGNSDPNVVMADGSVNVPIVADGKTVGTLWIRDRGVQVLFRVQQTVLRTITRSTLWGAIITGAVALLIAAWFSRRVTLPLKHMLQAIQRISEGDMDTRVTVESTDEFGTVAMALNDMTARLHRTEQARRHLVADVAHELRTPLTIIQGQLELVQQGVKKADAQTLLPIQDEVMRLSSLVEDLHQLSLAEAGKLPLQKLPTDIVTLVHRVVENFSAEAEERDVQLRFASDLRSPAELQVDGHRMTQVFVNLVGNALRYTPADGEIDVRVSKTDGHVRVEVLNSGHGIPAEQLPYIFDRFYRGEEDRSRHSGGMGLGLSIAKEFVEAHGGTISAESDVTLGTRFIVELPA